MKMNKDNINFEEWFANVAEVLQLHKDINHPSNRDYDYISAYYSGVPVPKEGDQLPSEHKGKLNDTRYIAFGEDDNDMEYYDSKTGMSVGPQDVIVQDIKRENHVDNFLETEAK
tara:strand:- start:97 stop:438 length:342 start_codon:yes stop_codon:yes gene_type:complete